MKFALVFLAVASSAVKYDISVNVSQALRKVFPFWRSTGFCPPLPHENASGYDLSEDERQNILYLGSIPNKGIEQVRIHWLLDLVTVLPNSNQEIMYNFTNLDILIDRLHENGLRPGFEIMGNPSDYFTTFDDDVQVKMWKEMVWLLAKRYIDRYGIDYVKEWNFETWNEPDHHDFDTLNITFDGFMRYYDACSEGLREADPTLKLGGPGGACHDPPSSPICWGLLEHCENGINYFTGEKGVRIDFISFHHKGGGSSISILDQEFDTIAKIRANYPGLLSVPIYNDEADPLVGWSTGEDWRADVRYGAIVVKIISQHYQLMIPANLSFALLSNDNGFMNFGPPHFFDQRTLNARFPMNNTIPKSVETIRKPVATVMGLLSLLGEIQLNSTVLMDNQLVGNDSNVGVIASLHMPTDDQQDSLQVTVIVYNSNDTANLTPSNASLLLNIYHLIPDNMTVQEMTYIHYRVDNQHTNPAGVWQSASKPVFPSAEVLDVMRAQQNPITLTGPSLTGGSQWMTTLELPLPAVDLIHFCSKPPMGPSQVSSVSLHQVHKSEVLVSWKDIPSRCLLTYNVYYSISSDTGYKHASTQNNIFTLLSHRVPGLDPNKNVTVYYKVSATDYWQREGEASLPVSISLN